MLKWLTTAEENAQSPMILEAEMFVRNLIWALKRFLSEKGILFLVQV